MRDAGMMPPETVPVKDLAKVELPSVKPSKVMLPISSNPPGAEILLNGKSTGEVTPTTISVRDGDEIEWTLRMNGYKPASDRLIVQQGRSLSVNLKADRKAYLDITVMGNGEISIDGKVIAARGPVAGFEVPADQDITVRVFDPATKATDEVKVRIAENTTRRITLIPRANISGPRPASR